ncbi:MAG: GNAT family N-acetyltransferase [Pseudomonadota bacterium]
MNKKTPLSIRKASDKDAQQVLNFIVALAEYERLADQVTATLEDIQQSLFVRKEAEVLIAEWQGEPAGFALFFHNYSTFLGKKGIHLEDLFVLPEFRGKGIGKHLLKSLAKIAVERDCGRLEWCVLDWNQPAIDFYKSLGAETLNEWLINRVTSESLLHLAKLSDAD